MTNWPDLYWRQMIRLDELGRGIDSSSHNSSAYKRGQADGSSVKTNYLGRTCHRKGLVIEKLTTWRVQRANKICHRKTSHIKIARL